MCAMGGGGVYGKAPRQSAADRFTKGHPKFGGRQKASPNKNLREHAITGLTRGGANKAKKAGKNGYINGLAYFFEDLAEKNSSAAAALAGKLISSEPPPDTSGFTPGLVVNVIPAAHGTSFSPGNITLLPFDISALAWEAFNAGDSAWKAYLKANDALFTAAAFEKLLALEVPEPTQQHNDGDDIEHSVIPLRRIARPNEPTEADLKSKSVKELWGLAASRLGISVGDIENMPMDELAARLGALPDDD